MANFMFVALPAYGHIDLGGGLRTAHVLKSAGNEVAWATGYPLCEFIKQQGFSFYPVAPHIDVGRMCEQTRPMEGVERSRYIIESFFLEKDIIQSGVEDLKRACDDFRPQVLCTEPYHFATAIVAETRDLPWATYGSTGLPIDRPAPIQRQWDRGMVRLNEVRLQYKLRPVHARTGNYSPYLCIRFSVPSLELCDDLLPPQSHFVGAPILSQLQGTQPPEWLSTLPDDTPLVYVTVGTVFRDNQLLKAIVHAVKSMNVDVILTTGVNLNFDSLEYTEYPNVHIHEYISHDEIFPYLSAVICHGGFSTTKDALSSGIPVLVIPIGSDNPENAQRVLRTGTGLVIERQFASTHLIQEALERILNEPDFLEQALRVKEEFQHYGRAEAAANLLSQLAETRRAVLRVDCKKVNLLVQCSSAS